jgi:hypothetical protein
VPEFVRAAATAPAGSVSTGLAKVSAGQPIHSGPERVTVLRPVGT